MLDKDKKTNEIKPTAVTPNKGEKKKEPIVTNEPVKKEATPTRPTLRRSSTITKAQNGVVLSPVKTSSKENDLNLENALAQIPITKELSTIERKECMAPPDSTKTMKMKLKLEIEDLQKTVSELKNTNTSLQGQLTESKRKKENLQEQIKALEEADKLQKEKEKENIAALERKQQQAIEEVKASYEKKAEEKRLRRQALKKKLLKKEGQVQSLKQKVEEQSGELEAFGAKSKSDTQLACLVREALEAKLQALTDSKEKECATLTEEIQNLKRQYFLSLGLALKLSKALMGEHSNQDLDTLFSAVQRENVPHQEWAKWLALKMLHG